MEALKNFKNRFFHNLNQEKFFSHVKKILIGFSVILLGIYVGNMLFGNSSLEVLIGLKNGKIELEQRIRELKHANARLQKELFELQQLDPDTKQ
ncbi:MAG: septum formation initiator [Campylobacteraceae bacterium]|nr:septum formation initiator [Campylobacteraceae bacterium]